MAKASVDFVEVDHSEVPEGSPGRGHLSAASLALIDGKTIWMEGEKNRSARFARMAKPRGFRVRTRVGEHGGKRGIYVWLEPLAQEQ